MKALAQSPTLQRIIINMKHIYCSLKKKSENMRTVHKLIIYNSKINIL